MCINNIQTRRHSAHNHPRNDTPKPKVRPEPSIPARICTAHSEPIQAGTPQHQLHQHKRRQPELRLVHAAVEAACEPARHRVGQQASGSEADKRADEGARVHVAGLDFVEEEWGT